MEPFSPPWPVSVPKVYAIVWEFIPLHSMRECIFLHAILKKKSSEYNSKIQNKFKKSIGKTVLFC